jgi:hypothetical protein
MKPSGPDDRKRTKWLEGAVLIALLFAAMATTKRAKYRPAEAEAYPGFVKSAVGMLVAVACFPSDDRAICLMGPAEGVVDHGSLQITHSAVLEYSKRKFTSVFQLPIISPQDRWRLVDALSDGTKVGFIIVREPHKGELLASHYLLCTKQNLEPSPWSCDVLQPPGFALCPGGRLRVESEPNESHFRPAHRVDALLSLAPTPAVLYKVVIGERRGASFVVRKDGENVFLQEVARAGGRGRGWSCNLTFPGLGSRLADGKIYSFSLCPAAKMRKVVCADPSDHPAGACTGETVRLALPPDYHGPVKFDTQSRRLFAPIGATISKGIVEDHPDLDFLEGKGRTRQKFIPVPVYDFDGNLDVRLTNQVTRALAYDGVRCSLHPFWPIVRYGSKVAFAVGCTQTSGFGFLRIPGFFTIGTPDSPLPFWFSSAVVILSIPPQIDLSPK